MKRSALIFLIVTGILLAHGMAWAASCPEIVPLGAMSAPGGFSATRVAADGAGNTYATDYFGRKVVVFNRLGNIINTLQLKERAVGIAVDGNGNIIVGVVKDRNGNFHGEVMVFGSDLAYKFSLGSGWGEFLYPVAIKVANGNIYVVDGRASAVKVYDAASGAPAGVITGSGASALINPTDMAIHPVTGNIYVVDRTLQTDTNYSVSGASTVPGLGAGLKVFTPAGDSVAGITYNIVFGYTGDAGTMASPTGIAIDANGFVYVSDTGTGVLQIFDDLGNAVCSKGGLIPRGSSQGVVLSANGSILVATAGVVSSFQTESYVNLTVTPDSVGMQGQQCVASSTSGQVTVGNAGPGTLVWTASASDSWIKLSNDGGTLAGKVSGALTISADAEALSSGTHTGTVTINSNGGSATVSVTMIKSAAPTLDIAAGSYSFTVKGSSIPLAESLGITINGDASGALTWAAAASDGWISVSPSNGGSGSLGLAMVGVRASGLGGLASGSYTGSVTVSASCSEIAPVVVPVHLTYVNGGTIIVETNSTDATFTVSGPTSATGGGLSATYEGVNEGVYTVTFGSSVAKGLKAPAAVVKTVKDGEVVVFTGIYKDYRKQNSVLATMGRGDMSMDDELKTFTANGELIDSMVVDPGVPGSTELRKGAVVATGDINGDGQNELLAGLANEVVRVFAADGQEIPVLSFTAFAGSGNAQVVTADLDGDGVAEIVVGAGGDNGNASVAKVFKVMSNQVMDTGMTIEATKKNLGIRLAAADIDGDGVDEIVATQGGQAARDVVVTIWRADTSAGVGGWKAAGAGSISAGKSYGSVDVAAGDLNGDGASEVVIAIDPSNLDTGVVLVEAYTASGVRIASMTVPAGKGASIAAGDTDFDGVAEIAVGSGTVSKGTPSVWIYGADGSKRASFAAFDNRNIKGIKVTFGQTVGR